MSGDQARDLRTWLQTVDEMGELLTVPGADWNLEIGAISRLNYRQANPRALLFDDIPGYEPGYRVLSSSVSNARRMAYTLGFGTDVAHPGDLVTMLEGKPGEWTDAAPDFAPTVVDDGPVLEHVVKGDELDLAMFPAPLWNEHDGGRFIGTGCIAFTSDPETGVVNGGAYRMQIQDDGRTVSVNIGRGKHGRQNVDRWLNDAERVPMTVSLGHDPLLLVVGGTEVPTGVSELDYAGAILGQPLQVINGPATGLPIPAGGEIVIEGWLNPQRCYQEGPFAEWTGHYTGGDRVRWSLDIEAVYHRTDPVILGAPPGKPPHDYSFMRSALKSAMIQDAVRRAGIPGVGTVWAHEQGGGRLLIAISIEQRYFGHARQAGYIASQCQAAAYMNRFVVVVDDDVDATSLDDVMWAVCTRCDPASDIEIMRKTWGSPADPILVDKDVPYSSRALIDATMPYEHRDNQPLLVEMSGELADRTMKKWGSLLGEGLPPPTAG